MANYYGRLDKKKPKKGVEFLMFEEAMQQSLQDKLVRLEKAYEDLRQKFHEEINKLTEQNKKLYSKYEFALKTFDKN